MTVRAGGGSRPGPPSRSLPSRAAGPGTSGRSPRADCCFTVRADPGAPPPVGAGLAVHAFSPLMTLRLLLSIAGMLLSTVMLGSCGDSVGNGAATDLVLIGGNGQAAIIDDTLPVPLSIRAVNQAGAGVAGVTVLWTAAAGGLVFADSITDPHGDAIATWVLGPIVGAQTATATVTGLNGSPLTFTATANPAANTLTWTSEQLPSGTYGGTWASSAADVFAVGAGGTIRHFNGSSWELQNSGTLNDLHGVWGSSSGDVFAAGSGGTVLHYDGANWGLVGNPLRRPSGASGRVRQAMCSPPPATRTPPVSGTMTVVCGPDRCGRSVAGVLCGVPRRATFGLSGAV